MDPLLVAGLVVACFVAFNIGATTTGPAFGPAVGSGAITRVTAAALMSVFFFGGAWTIGRRVVNTLGEDLVGDPSVFTLEASIVILFFIGGALLVGNLTGAPASTSMTAVGSIAGFGLALGQLDLAVVGEILAWWVLSPVLGFWLSMMIGRYLYPRVDRVIAIDRTEGPLLIVDRSGPVPRPALEEHTTRREVVGVGVIVTIGCLMAFSSGTSNIANAVAPLVGSGDVAMNPAIGLGSVAVAVGAFTLGRRTMETLGNDITDLPLTAAILVAVVASTITVLLSVIGIPASFVVIATMSIVGLGWGRATRTVTIADAVRGSALQLSIGALTADERSPTVGDPERRTAGSADGPTQPIGEESAEEVPPSADLFDPSTTARIILMQNVVPIIATGGSFLTFQLTVV
ncbi:inorganic phosphate transporter, PiT family [Halobiforma haloterrestris]|uniref:Phosphate transporter n=2 Tax=Natronobacterium haloterrestre TaxID=148448 RepID=A0A1I1DXI7_NATHA|nr:inorganic phosphate transporter, PiT family [Halobiforma haloterrestris]